MHQLVCVCVTQLPVAVGKSRHRAAIHGKDGHAATGHGALGKRRGAAIPAAGKLCGMFSVSLPERNFELEKTRRLFSGGTDAVGVSPSEYFRGFPGNAAVVARSHVVGVCGHVICRERCPIVCVFFTGQGDVQCDLCGETVSPLVPGRRVKCRRT